MMATQQSQTYKLRPTMFSPTNRFSYDCTCYAVSLYGSVAYKMQSTHNDLSILLTIRRVPSSKMNALQSLFQPIITGDSVCRLMMLASLADILMQSSEGNGRCGMALLPGADCSSAFLFSLHFHHTPVSMAAPGEMKGR